VKTYRTGSRNIVVNGGPGSGPHKDGGETEAEPLYKIHRVAKSGKLSPDSKFSFDRRLPKAQAEARVADLMKMNPHSTYTHVPETESHAEASQGRSAARIGSYLKQKWL
jgi:hypothetical protein